jgi:hypothetical protein
MDQGSGIAPSRVRATTTNSITQGQFSIELLRNGREAQNRHQNPVVVVQLCFTLVTRTAP